MAAAKNSSLESRDSWKPANSLHFKDSTSSLGSDDWLMGFSPGTLWPIIQRRSDLCQDLRNEHVSRSWSDICLKPRSHIACNRSATSMWPKFRVVTGRLQGCCKEVDDWFQKVEGTIWLQGGFGCCKWNLSATKSTEERFLVVADWSPTSCSGCRQSQHSFQSLTDSRPVADRSPKVADFLQS